MSVVNRVYFLSCPLYSRTTAVTSSAESIQFIQIKVLAQQCENTVGPNICSQLLSVKQT